MATLPEQQPAEFTPTLRQLVVAIQRGDAVPDEPLFAKRPDFLIWRRLNSYRSRLLDSESLAGISDLAVLGLQSPNDAIVWGTLWATSALARKSPHRLLLTLDELRSVNQERLQLTELCGLRLQFQLDESIARSAAVECKAIAATVLSIAWEVRHELRLKTNEVWDYQRVKPVNGDAAAHFDIFEEYLRQIDPAWALGKELSTSQLLVERIVPQTSRSDWKFQLVRAMLTTQHVVRGQTYDWTPKAVEMLERAYLLAVSAWQTVHFYRRGREGTSDKRDSSDRAATYAATLELSALDEACQAARDSGRFVLSAALSHLLLLLVPKDLATTEAFRGLGDRHGFAIREAGLQVDERFARDKQINKNKARDRAHGPNSDIWRGSPAWHARIQHDKASGAWGEVLSAYGGGPGDLRRVRNDAQGGLPVKPTIIKKAFELNLRYGCLDGASDLLALESFEPSRSGLMHFVKAVNTARQIAPFGNDIAASQKWHGIIRRRWRDLQRKNQVEGLGSTFAVHEVLLGRTASIVRGADPEDARRLAERYYAKVRTDKVRELYKESPESLSGGLATLNTQTESLLYRETEAELGPPAFLSLVNFEDEWGVLAAGRGRRQQYRRVRHTVDVSAHIAAIKRTAQTWLRMGARRSIPIPWGIEFSSLAKLMIDMANAVTDSPRWLMLSTEPALAGLPWQNLLRRMGYTGVVSIVPSASWAWFAGRSNFFEPPATWLDHGIDLRSLSAIIQHHQAGWERDGLSIACVLGHGTLSDGSATVQVRDAALGFSEWMKIASRRVVLVHSCFGGAISDAFSGDMGGLPGMALAIGCRLFIAPVTSVPIAAATLLQEHLFGSRSASADIGSRYLEAIAEDETVSLYSLFGFANETS